VPSVAWHDLSVLVLEVVLAIAVLLAVGAVVAVRRRELAPAGRDAPDTRIPPTTTSMTPNDVDSLRFGLAFRGYRMDQVDDALDRLRDELRLRDERIAGLEQPAGANRPTAQPARAEEPSAFVAAPAPEPMTGELVAAGVAEAAEPEPAATEPEPEPAKPEPEPESVPEPKSVPKPEPVASATADTDAPPTPTTASKTSLSKLHHRPTS